MMMSALTAATSSWFCLLTRPWALNLPKEPSAVLRAELSWSKRGLTFRSLTLPLATKASVHNQRAHEKLEAMVNPLIWGKMVSVLPLRVFRTPVTSAFVARSTTPSLARGEGIAWTRPKTERATKTM